MRFVLLDCLMQESRRNGYYQIVAMIDDELEVVGDMNFVAIEFDALNVMWVVTEISNMLDGVFVTHPPIGTIAIVAKQFDQCSGPRATAQHTNSRFRFERNIHTDHYSKVQT